MREKAFTLVELLMAVIIIGILATIAIPAYTRVVERGRISWARSALSALKDAELSYFGQWETYNTNVATVSAFNDVTNPNNDLFWDFSIAVGGAGVNYGFTIIATRTGGQWNNATVFLDDVGSESGTHPLR